MMAFGAKIKLSVNTSGASAFRTEIQKYVNTATADKPIKLKNFSVSITKDQQKKIIRDIQAYLSSDNALTLKIGKIDATGAISKLRQQLQTMLSGLSITGLKEFLGETDIDKITKDIEEAKEAATQWAAQMRVINDISKRLGTTYQSALSGNRMIGDTTQIAEITAAYTAWQTKVEALRSTEIALSAEELQSLQQEGIELQQKITLIQEAQVATEQAADAEARAAAQREADAKKELLLAQQQVSLKSQVQRYILSNSKAYKSYGTELDGIMYQLQSESGLTDESLKQIRMRFNEIQASARAAGKTGNTFFDTLKKGWEKFGGWSIVTKSMMLVVRLFKEMFNAVKELDAAMTELKKVTDLTDASYEKFLVTATNLAKSVGASLADTVNATADFARLGYSLSDATALSKAALIYKNVGDGIDDISTATESLISTIKAFGIEADDALGIVDKFNEVGNKFAISSEGIGTALQKSASSMAAANNTLEETIALITGMNAVVQNPEVVGTALKTVSMYLRAAKTEAEETGESVDGMASSVSELRNELLTLTGGKVDIMLNDKSFKSTYQIMKELSEVWEDLSDIDTANILELIGGKRNATAITSLLTNFEDAEAALLTASDAAGSATIENEKYLDSIAGKVDQLTASFEAMSASVLDSSIVKWVVDLGTALINAVAKLQELSLLLPFVVATLVTLSYIKLYKQTQDTAQQVSILVNRFVAEKAATDSLIASYWSLTAAQQKEVLTKLQEKVASGAMTATTYQEITAKLGLTAATTGAKVATDSYTASIKALLASNPIGWIIMAISLIPTLISWISKLHKSDEELIEDANKIIETYSEAKDSYESNIKSLESMRKEFEQLSQGVDANGKNVGLTASQYETYLDLIKQIVDISPDVCKGYDDEGNAIVNYTTVLEDAIAAQETYMNNQRNMYLGSGEEVFDGKQAEYKKAKKSLGDAAGANDLKDKSLDDALNPGFWESIFHADEAQAKLDAYQNAFAELGIQWRTGVDTWRESTDSVMQMYENADEIMVLLRQSGAYTEEELVKIEDRLHGLAGSYSTLKNIEKEQVDYLAEWSKDQTWYDQIPVGALDEFYDGLMAVNDPLSDYETNLKNASKFGTEFSKAIATDEVKNLLKLAEGLKDGSVSLEDYNKAVSDFINSFSGSDNVKNTLSSYLVGLSDNAIVVTKDYTKSLSDLSDTISNLQDDYKLLEQAEKDVAESGSLSADTIKSIQEAMSSGENYLDYLEIENGAIKLNTQAWKDRAAATLLGDFEEIQKEVAALELQNAELKEKIRLEEEERKRGNDGNIHTQIIQQYTNEIEANNQKIRENQELLELYGAIYDEIANDFYNAFNYDSMVSGLDSIGSSVSKLVSSMQSLAEGTALTKQELAKLALAYPELLEASDLFTDGSIQGQQAMLDNVLKVYEAEYDATIDTKIAELTATKQAFEDRLKAEKQKATIIDEIANAEVNNTAEYRAWLTNKLADFNEIEEANYITYQDGVLGITEEALNARLSDEYDTANKTASEIWAPMSTTIATAFSSGGTAGLSAMETVRSKLGSWISKIKNAFLSLARTIASAITGKEYDDGASTGGIDTSVSVDVGDVKFDGKKVTINGQSLDEWTSEQQRVTADRIDQITNEIGKLDISIGNLEKLKGLDLKTIYGDSGKSSASSSKEVEEYIANVDEYYAALKRLETALAKVENLENELSHTDDPAAKIKLYDQLIDAYKEEAEAERKVVGFLSTLFII